MMSASPLARLPEIRQLGLASGVAVNGHRCHAAVSGQRQVPRARREQAGAVRPRPCWAAPSGMLLLGVPAAPFSQVTRAVTVPISAG